MLKDFNVMERSGYPGETSTFLVISPEGEEYERRKVRHVVEDSPFKTFYPLLECGETESEPTVSGIIIYKNFSNVINL